MFLPEYTITNTILKNIAQAEYGKAIIDNTTILPAWQKSLQKEGKINFIQATLTSQGIRLSDTEIKRVVDSLKEPHTAQTQFIADLNSTLELLDTLQQEDLDEDVIKTIHKSITSQQGVYRKNQIANKPQPEEILAEMVELIDWYNSLDAKDTHPIIKAGVLKAQLEQIEPFDQNNSPTVNIAVLLSLKQSAFDIQNYVYIENFYHKSGVEYDKALYTIETDEGDLTKWLEYFTEGFAYEIAHMQEKIQLLAKDTQIAKASGRAKLTQRQEKIVMYLQDYGMLQNTQFAQIFPDVSEDTVLRELKKLMDKGIVVKQGSTKASRYELR